MAQRCLLHVLRNFHVTPVTDFYASALWRPTCLTHTEYFSHCFAHGSHVSALSQIRGFDFAYISALSMTCSWNSAVQSVSLALIKLDGKALAFSQPAVNTLSKSMIRATGAPTMKTTASEGRFIASSSLPKSMRRCQRVAPTQAFALLSWDVERWSFMEICRWKTCDAWCGNVGDGCCASCTPRCTKCNTTWRSK